MWRKTMVWTLSLLVALAALPLLAQGGQGGQAHGYGPGDGTGTGQAPQNGTDYGPGDGTGTGVGVGPGHGHGPGHGRGRGDCLALGLGPDPATLTTATGWVVGLTGGPGQGFPTLVLDLGGEELALVVSPYRTWRLSGFETAPDQKLEVSYMKAERDGVTHWVAVSVSDPATGATVQLRDPETGLPVVGP